MSNVGVVGAGTWGIALARMLCSSGHSVTVWSNTPANVDAMSAARTHRNLPGVRIPDAVRFTKDIADVCRGQDVVLFAVPSVYVRATARKAAPFIQPGQILVDAAKGMEADTLMTMTEVIRDELTAYRSGMHRPGVDSPGTDSTGTDSAETDNPGTARADRSGTDNPVVALSGPTHAEEVARDLPATIVSACADLTAAEAVQAVFMNEWMRVYTNDDVKGVELCGALKNIIALACGISTGLGCGDNAKAAIITRGLAEMERLGKRMGCRLETFAGLAGMGDLIVTSTSLHSRNNRCGLLIGQGVPPAEAVKQVGMVVEGVNAIPAAIRLAERYDVEMPIVRAVEAVVRRGAESWDVVRELMGRAKTAEWKHFSPPVSGPSGVSGTTGVCGKAEA